MNRQQNQTLLENEQQNQTPFKNEQQNQMQIGTAQGPLRYAIETSSPQVEAGKPFSVFIRLANPYSFPVVIRNVTTRLPIEFVDCTAQERRQQRQELERRLNKLAREAISEKLPELKDVKTDRKEKYVEFLKDVFRMLPFGSIFSASYSFAQLVTASSLVQTEKVMKHIDDTIQTKDIEILLDRVKETNKPTESFKQASIDLLNEKLAELDQVPEIILQPGDSTVKVFTLKTQSALLFSPSAYNLHIQTECIRNSVVHHDSVDYQLNVRASLSAIITGSVIGSVVGYLLRDIFQERGLLTLISQFSYLGLLEWIIKLVGNCLLGIVLVIAFARKKDAQPILTIEDFWGGLFIGVIAGYTGKSILDKYLVPADSG